MLGYKEKSWSVIVISYGLAITALWFGINEMLFPANWVGLEPSFLATSFAAVGLVFVHGILLFCIGLSLITNKYTKIAAWLFSLMLLQIIITFILQNGAWDIIIRDIGLLGATLSIALGE
ncbi:MAG: hypothetical protein HQ402_03540 [Parcubacteria group bacterium]|nr:hypothetical protein [Parcubacteria group bacterium]